MKNILLGLSVLLSLSAASAEAKDFLSPHQAKIVVGEIDSICADTWCEGDFGYRFNTFKCDDKTGACKLAFQMACMDIGEDDMSRGWVKWTKFECKFKGYDRFFDFVEMNTNEDGSHWYSLRDKFYEDVSDNCISEKEKVMRKVCY